MRRLRTACAVNAAMDAISSAVGLTLQMCPQKTWDRVGLEDVHAGHLVHLIGFADDLQRRPNHTRVGPVNPLINASARPVRTIIAP